ncbi:MAG TPA: Gfo/Idh/MocA family oxidoreductase [Nakamurella sp.]|jgi:predicted dehydrogenase
MPPFPTALPQARTPDPTAAPTLRWGIIGPGWIAERFVGAVQRNTNQRVLAVGSRGADRSAAFAARHGIERSYGSYEALLADPDIDVVYIATPHNAHFPCAKLAVTAGKHTVVEKPIALNACQATELRDLAAARHVFLMEALWTLFLPKFDVIRQLLADGVFGDVHTVLADHGEYFEAGHRILRHDLAGGPMLDLGTYPVAFSGFVLGSIAQVRAIGQPHPAGVNGQASAVLATSAGALAVVNTTVFGNTPTTASITGTAATLAIGGPFYQPGPMTLTSVGGDRLVWDEPAIAHEGLFFEAAEAARCIAEGRTESPLRPVADSVATLRVMDEIRRQIGQMFDEER